MSADATSGRTGAGDIVRALPADAPDWARRAHHLVSLGVGVKATARIVGRTPKAVRYWVRPGARSRYLATSAGCRERRRADLAAARCRCGRVLWVYSTAETGLCATCYQRARARQVNDRDQRLARMWQDDRSVQQIARALGMSEAGVRMRAAALRRRGVDLERRAAQGRPRSQDYQRAVELWNAGTPSGEIARELNMESAAIVAALMGYLRTRGWSVASRSQGSGSTIERVAALIERRIDELAREEAGLERIVAGLATSDRASAA